MTYSQISTVLNNSIVPAIMGGDYTINPDLSNIVDLGTKISAMSADDFKMLCIRLGCCLQAAAQVLCVLSTGNPVKRMVVGMAHDSLAAWHPPVSHRPSALSAAMDIYGYQTVGQERPRWRGRCVAVCLACHGIGSNDRYG